MPREPLESPANSSNSADLLDWLELEAFFSPSGLARLDVVISALAMQNEEFNDQIDAKDTFRDEIVSRIEAEFDFRQKDIENHYPFSLSGDAAELTFVGDGEDANSAFYLVCLLASHRRKSPYLNFGASEEDVAAIVRRLENSVFQIVSTIAMAGLADGPAVSIGWPRRSDETILAALNRAAANNAGIVVRARPNPVVENPNDKDGGMDVIAWRSCVRPPPANFYFGQVASGRDWTEKAASSKVRSFKEKYIDSGPLGNQDFATLIPYRISDDVYRREYPDHLAILDRTSLPKWAEAGLRLANRGIAVDEVDSLETVFEWIKDFRAAALT